MWSQMFVQMFLEGQVLLVGRHWRLCVHSQLLQPPLWQGLEGGAGLGQGPSSSGQQAV